MNPVSCRCLAFVNCVLLILFPLGAAPCCGTGGPEVPVDVVEAADVMDTSEGGLDLLPDSPPDPSLDEPLDEAGPGPDDGGPQEPDPDDGGSTPCDGGDCPADRIRLVADGTGIQELSWDGVNLFAGVGGYYIIGSCTGADDSNNVTSQGSDGRTLYAPGGCPGAPFSMSISGLYPIRVSIEVGPLPADYRTLSVPLDPVKSYFVAFSFDGTGYEVGCALSWEPRSGSSARFDSIPTPCTIPDVGGVGVARVHPVPAWGEITGPVATIRRTFISGDGRELAFINHPGTNNIELGFSDDFSTVLPAGTVVRLEEEIWVTGPGTEWERTEWTFEAESPAMGHAIGRPEADGWSASTDLDPPGALCYGPYARDVPAGSCEALFRMMIDNNVAGSDVVVRIDVNDFGTDGGGCGDCVIAQGEIRRTDFAAPGTYQDFILSFISPGVGHALEFRTYWEGLAYIREDRVQVRVAP